MNHFKLPFVLPFKFVPYQMTGMHFDDKWHCLQIRSFETKATYKQKWIKETTTPLQMESSLTPDDLILLNAYGAPVKFFEWEEVADLGDSKIWQTTFDVSDEDDGTYYLFQKVAFEESIVWQTISEPIAVAESHINVLRFKYKNSFNKDDIAWTTGLEMIFQVEADIQDFDPESVETDYVSENSDTKTLDVIPSRKFILYVGDTRDGKSGVPPYMIDILNRVFSNDFIEIEGKRFDNVPGQKLRVIRIRNYPLIGATLELVESFNSQSLEFSDTTPFAPGLVTTYNIETGFFGPAAIVPVIEVEENG